MLSSDKTKKVKDFLRLSPFHVSTGFGLMQFVGRNVQVSLPVPPTDSSVVMENLT